MQMNGEGVCECVSWGGVISERRREKEGVEGELRIRGYAGRVKKVQGVG